jgi:ABC-2 type transport system permease protein
VNWQAIARNDVRRAVNQRGVWALLGGFLLGFGGLAALILYVGAPNFEGYVALVKAGAGLLVPLAGIVLGYESIVGERESGTAVLSLSLPHSRSDLVLGKLVSRTVLLTGAIAVAALVTAVGMLLTYPSFDVPRYVGLIAGIAGYGAVFLWLSAGLSMALSTSRRVIAAAFGTYIGLTLFWNVLIELLVQILFRFQPPRQPESWATFSTFVGPHTAYRYLLGELANIGAVPPVAAVSTAEFITPAVAILGLAGWAVLPVAAGYLSFRRNDL